MTQKDMREAKELFTKNADQIQAEGYEFIGHGTQGAIFLNKETNQCVVVQAVAKKETFNPWEDIDALAERVRWAEIERIRLIKRKGMRKRQGE